MDGDIHELQKEEDERREKALTEMGLRELSAVGSKIKSLISI